MITKKRKNQRGQDLFFSILMILLFFSLFAFLIFSNLRINKKRESLMKNIESLEKEIKTLEEKNELLKAGISESKEDEFWEEKIREQGYQKPGEKQVIILPPEGEKIEESKKGALQNFLEWIKGKLK